MSSLLSKLSGKAKPSVIDPREIFMALPQRDKKYEYPRDVQAEVWKKWFDGRDSKNNIIKMNTGSGKTVVGLIILQSCLNEGKGPAVYVVPDKYLVSQVCSEAKKLGIAVTDSKDNYAYTEKKAILVTTIFSLVNGRSVFGMRPFNNYPIGSILIDDVHACLDTITNQFSLRIPSNHELYTKIITLFESDWKAYNQTSYSDIVEIKDCTKMADIPFWIWQEKQSDIYKLLSAYNNEKEENRDIFFSLPLLGDCLRTCDCFITKNEIEIIPEGISIGKISSFAQAQRRIFMSATLSDDSIFVSAIGLRTEDFPSIITPENANDIGDRLILFPRHLNNSITNEEIRSKVYSISQSNNVMVIVPSFEKAAFWDPDRSRTATKENINSIIEDLKSGTAGLKVLVNRYDGIDLPDNACRLLVIDGLPPLKSLKEKYIQSIDPSSVILRREQIQRIEQGMGRGVRSNNDSCCIVLMGENLADVLLRNDGTSFFSNATREQYSLSKELWDILKQENANPSVDEVFALATYSINRDVEWIMKSKERLSEVKYSCEPQINSNALELRAAYDYSIALQWDKALERIQVAINHESQATTKGYLKQIKAKYMNCVDKETAQKILLSGRTDNPRILAPIQGITYERAVNNTEQAESICAYVKNFNRTSNDLVLHVNAITSKLSFSSPADDFEEAMQEIGSFIGFNSSRPDKEYKGSGPDNLWAIGNGIYCVIECKNESEAYTISKRYCDQLGGEMRWFAETYGSTCSAIPIMVHISQKIDSQANEVEGMRIINSPKLDLLIKNTNEFAIALSRDNNWSDGEMVRALLTQYKLNGTDIVATYTVPTDK